MSLTQSMVSIEKKQIEKKEGNKVVEVKVATITKRVYPCRPQVLERKQWAKFGEVKDVPRGQHKKGQFTQNQKVVFDNGDNNDDEELELVKKIKQAAKESVMSKNLRTQ